MQALISYQIYLSSKMLKVIYNFLPAQGKSTHSILVKVLYKPWIIHHVVTLEVLAYASISTCSHHLAR